MKLTLIRHAEVEEKYIGKYNGHNDIGLSEKGKMQAQKLAKYFENEIFDKVYCSDLKRARETLKPFVQSKSALYTDSLREKSWGRHEGLSFDEIVTAEKIQYENFEQWISALDGEEQEAYNKRVQTFFQKQIFDSDAENILVVTHGGVMRTFFSMVKKISFEESYIFELPYASYLLYDEKSAASKIEICNLF